MGYTLTLRKDAELDVGAHFEFYEEKREGLGHDFLLCLEEALDKVQRNPLNYRKIHRELRGESRSADSLTAFFAWCKATKLL